MPNPPAAPDRPSRQTAPAKTDLKCAWVENETAFGALREEWNRLVDASPKPSIFLRHEWFDAAWCWRRQDPAVLAILCVRHDNQLVGIAPFVAVRAKNTALGPRRLEFLSVPDTQSADLLVHSHYTVDVVNAMLNALRVRSDWDAIRLTHLTGNSCALAEFAAAVAARGFRAQRAVYGENPVIELAPSWETFYAGRGRRLKKSNNLTANRIKKSGEIGIDWLRGKADAAAVQKWQAEIVRISAASWKETTGLTLDNAGPQAFMRRLLVHAAKNGWLSLWRLTLDGQTVATETQIEYAGEVFALRADYDQTYRELSVGSYLNWKLLEQMFASDLERYFLGPGGNAYKLRWTERALALDQLEVFNRTLRGRIAAYLEITLRPRLRALRGRFRRVQAESVAQ